MMRLSAIFKALVFSCILFGCGSDDVSTQNTFDIYLDYWNTTGVNPEIRFDELKTSREVKIDFSKTFGGQTEGTNLTKVIIDNFRIVDDNSNNYNIESIKAYEFSSVSNAWKEDVEFTMDYSQSRDVSVVLVLDRSESLGEDFANVKQYAIDFVEQIFRLHPEAKMGIVDFSTTVSSYPITANKEALKSYISSLETDQFTALYQAVDEGVEMLLRSQSQSRVLVTFTDGSDNMSDPDYNIDAILGKIKNDKNSYKITSFFIGLEGKGGVDSAVLTKLASNGGVASFPKSTSELKEVFEKFGRLVSNVYHLSYTRNRQVVLKTSPIKLRFEIKAGR